MGAAMGAMSATLVGHYPWFYTNNRLRESLPQFDFVCGKYVRNAVIGFFSAAVSETCSSWLRVFQMLRQPPLLPSCYMYMPCYMPPGHLIFLNELFGRGLQTRILTNGLQGAMFTISWRAIAEYLSK